MANKEEGPKATAGAILRPDALREIAQEAESALIKEVLETDSQAEQQRKALKEAFMSREVHPNVVERINAVVERAAKARKHEVEIARFPASFCNDGGRRINNNEPDWPESLEGIAKRGYEFYVQHYKPLGFKMRAQVMDYPKGMLGDIALFLTW